MGISEVVSGSQGVFGTSQRLAGVYARDFSGIFAEIDEEDARPVR